MVVGPLSAVRRVRPERAALAQLPRALLRRCAADFLAERARWALWTPVGFGVGVALYFGLWREPDTVAIVGLGAAAAGAIALRARLTSERLRFALALAAAAAAGVAYASVNTERAAAPVLPRRIGPVDISGEVDTVQTHGRNLRVVMRSLVSPRLAGSRIPAGARITIRGAGADLKPGDWIRLRATLMPPPGPAAPESYDFGRAAYFDRIGAVGFAYGKPARIAPLMQHGLWRRMHLAVALLRWRMTRRIEAALPGSVGGVASALITGDRGLISEDDEAALRDAGLAHVLAIAGLHMALVGLGLFWILRAALAAIPPIALAFPIKKWAAAAALLGAGFYLVISGGATPATRAFIMLATMLTAILFDRPALSMRSVALAATIILLLRPESLIEPGFQMSFSAVVSLVAVAEWEQARRARHHGSGPQRFAEIRRYLRGIAITSFVGSVATAPFAAYHFDRATHYAVLGNLLAMPIMGFVTMPAAALSVIAMPFGLEAWPLKMVGWGVAVMLSVGRFVSGLPGAISTVSALPVGAVAALSLGGLWIGLWRRSWRWFGLAPIAGGLFAAMLVRGPDLLVARDASTVAIRGGDGVLRLLRPARDAYSATEWLKRDGDSRAPDAAVATSADGVRCDGYGCIARAPDGSLIAAPARIEALAEDCARAAILVSAAPVGRACRGPKLVIDRFDVARAGGYAIWFGPTLRVETVEGERGLRPWSQRPRAPLRRSQYRRMRPTSLPWTRTRSAP